MNKKYPILILSIVIVVIISYFLAVSYYFDSKNLFKKIQNMEEGQPVTENGYIRILKNPEFCQDINFLGSEYTGNCVRLDSLNYSEEYYKQFVNKHVIVNGVIKRPDYGTSFPDCPEGTVASNCLTPKDKVVISPLEITVLD